MATRKTTYNIIAEEEVLHSIELTDDQNRVVSLKIFEHGLSRETLTIFNDDGSLKKEIHLENGEELSRSEFEYDSESRIISQTLIISDEPYEIVKHEYADDGFTRITIQDEEEVEKLVQIQSGQNYENKFFFGNDKVETQKYKFNSSLNSSVLELYDNDGKLIGYAEMLYDGEENIVEEKEFSASGSLLTAVIFEKNDGILLKKLVKDFTVSGENEQIFTYEYDSQYNQIRTACHAPGGDLLGTHLRAFDNQNRVIEEKGYSAGSFDAVYGTNANDRSFHLTHKYKRVDLEDESFDYTS